MAIPSRSNATDVRALTEAHLIRQHGQNCKHALLNAQRRLGARDRILDNLQKALGRDLQLETIARVDGKDAPDLRGAFLRLELAVLEFFAECTSGFFTGRFRMADGVGQGEKVRPVCRCRWMCAQPT